MTTRFNILTDLHQRGKRRNPERVEFHAAMPDPENPKRNRKANATTIHRDGSRFTHCFARSIVAGFRYALPILSAVLFSFQLLAEDALRSVASVAFDDASILKQKAESGDCQAQVALGDLQSSNFHPAEAIQWYRKSANQGNIDAAYKLGSQLFRETYDSSTGVIKPNPAEAIRWTLCAATNHHSGACLELARAFKRGQGITTNLVEAYSWAQLALNLKNNSLMARVELNQIALRLDSAGIQKAQSLAAEFMAGDWRHSLT